MIPSQNATEASGLNRRWGSGWVWPGFRRTASCGEAVGERAFPSKCIGKTLQGFKQESNVIGFTSF